MRVLPYAVVAFLVAAAPGSAIAQRERDEVTAPREAAVSASGARSIEIEARAGSLRIVGRKGTTEVRATGTARASDRDLLEQIKLIATREGDVVSVVVETPDSHGWRGNRYAGLDLLVEVPDALSLKVEDSSGEIEIRGVAGVDLRDSSGEIEMENIGGPIRIEDSSGQIGIRKVRGDVNLRDGSGEIVVRGVQGSVVVEVDGSGSIDVSDVTGDVSVGSDGSGGIEVQDVGGDFTVGNDGSGGISYRNIKGTVKVPRKN